MVFKKASSIVGMNYSLFKIFEFEYINVIIISLGISLSKLLSSFSYSLVSQIILNYVHEERKSSQSN